MKKIVSIILVMGMCCLGISCSKKEVVPQVSQMKSICELATIDCYYHNVAKYSEDDATRVLWWTKDRKFWIQYSGIVRMGIDTSLVNVEVQNDDVTITIPPAKVLECRIDDKTLTKDSFIVAKGSAKIGAEHQTEAFKAAQEEMQKEAEQDTVLLASAQRRAQKLLEDYVTNIGDCVGKTYKIKWVYLDGAEQLSDQEIEETE